MFVSSNYWTINKSMDVNTCFTVTFPSNNLLRQCMDLSIHFLVLLFAIAENGFGTTCYMKYPVQ